MVLLVLPMAAAAQQASFVTMTGANAKYPGGTMTANFLPPADSSQFDYLKYHFPFTVSAPLNSSGQWSMSLGDTSSVLPANSQWRLQLCSAGTFGAPTCFSVTMAITCINNVSCTGTTLDLTSNFAAAPSPPALTTAPDMVAYFGPITTTTLGAGTSVPLTPISPITITRVEWSLTTLGVGCTTTPILSVTIGGTAQSYTVPMTTVNSAFSGHVDGTLNVAANGNVGLKVTTAAAGCTTNPGTQMVVHYKMQ